MERQPTNHIAVHLTYRAMRPPVVFWHTVNLRFAVATDFVGFIRRQNTEALADRA